LIPEASLLLSAAHLMLFHSGYEKRMIWLYDVHRLVSLYKDRLDWENVIARSGEFGWSAALLACLQGVRELLQTPLPVGILEELERVDDPRGRQFVYRKGIATRSKFKRIFNTLATLDRKTQYHFIFNQLFPTPKQVRLWYKPRKVWYIPFSLSPTMETDG
jgi:hypothetical protein